MNTIKDMYQKWQKLYNAALSNMQKAKGMGNAVLIEIAAQHPLKDGMFPDVEFKARLDAGIELYNKLSGRPVKIYVPGSRHVYNGIEDIISLSESGKRYLMQHNIPEIDIFADDANIEFMSDKGVYNSTDECFVAVSLFKKHNFQELYSVCSSGQMLRKMLCYIKFGCVPNFYTVSCEKMYHNPIDEIFKYIPKVLKEDETFEENIKNTRRV